MELATVSKYSYLYFSHDFLLVKLAFYIAGKNRMLTPHRYVQPH